MRWWVFCIAVVLGSTALAFDSTRWILVRGGSWVPSSDVLVKLEVALEPAVSASSKSRGNVPTWNQYTFQYQGRSSLIGHKFVYVNAYCNGAHLDAQNTWVAVMDGGACYFSAKYDLASGQVYDVSVNGIA